MSWPVDPVPHQSWRTRRRDWPWPPTREIIPVPPPPDYNTVPINVTRMYAGAVARDLEIDRMYYEYNQPPATPQPPNLVWPSPEG
jgi:hypothetical protein